MNDYTLASSCIKFFEENLLLNLTTIIPPYRRENWGLQTLRNLPKVMQLGNYTACEFRFESKVCDSFYYSRKPIMYNVNYDHFLFNIYRHKENWWEGDRNLSKNIIIIFPNTIYVNSQISNTYLTYTREEGCWEINVLINCGLHVAQDFIVSWQKRDSGKSKQISFQRHVVRVQTQIWNETLGWYIARFCGSEIMCSDTVF